MSNPTRYNLDKQSLGNLHIAMNGGSYDPKILYKDFKYFTKTNNLLVNMIQSGKSVPAGFEKYLLPYSPGQTGGGYDETEYHNALHKIVAEMKQNGKTIPAIYEQYATHSQNGGCGCDGDTDKFKYKAYKYHMKNHELIKMMQAGGKPIPPGYEEYLEPCQLN